MYPVICQFGPVTVYSYGFMLAVAAGVCTFLAARDAKKIGVPSGVIPDFTFWTVVAGILGARFFYILLNYRFFMDHPLEIVMVQNGGLAWHGGLIAATLTGLRFIRRRGLPLPTMLDLVAPYAALGESIGRIGCFLNGCCYGREVPWGIYFPVHHARLHPTQLYATAGLFILFLILRRYRKASQTPGDVFVAYLFGASSLRFMIEFFRADHDVLVLGLSVYQWVCVALMATAVYVHLRLKSRSRARP
jgi:phosphatidylglycerol:prolipoprotein diacylglycerol transferase